MKKYLIALLFIISATCFPLYTNDYVDITHMVNISSIGLSYEDNEVNVYAYVINNYTMSKSDYNTSLTTSPATIISAKANTIEKAFFLMMDTIFVNLNFSHVESFVLHENFITDKNINNLINFISNSRDFYPKFNIYITKEHLKDIYNIDYFNDTSSYYSLLTEYKSVIEHHHTTFIDLINDFTEPNYFILYPSIKLIDNLSKDNKQAKSLKIDGYFYYTNGLLNHLTYQNNSLLYLLYSTNDIIFNVDKQNYLLKSYSLKTARILNSFYIFFYSRSTFEKSLSTLLENYITDLYNKGIDVYNLKYFNIEPANIKIIAVEKNQKQI